jgi:hypothetical protein
MLYVGNSFFLYNNGLPRIVGGLLDAAEPNGFESTMAAISGSSLSWHSMETYLTPGAEQSFSFAANNTPPLEKAHRPFDVVIMQDCSQCPIHPQLRGSFHEQVRKHSQTVFKHGAKPVLFMTWAYANKPEMTAQLAEQYTIAGNANGALVVPVGLAFARSIAKNPQIDLYDQDKRHPAKAGSYLAACTILAAVYGKSPVGNRYTGGLDPKTAAFLQQVAAETVEQYLGR